MRSVLILRSLKLPEDLEKLIFNEMTNKYHEYNQLQLLDLKARQEDYNNGKEEFDFYLEIPEIPGLSDDQLDDVVASILAQLEEQGMLNVSLIDIENMSNNPTIQRLNKLLDKDVDDVDPTR